MRFFSLVIVLLANASIVLSSHYHHAGRRALSLSDAELSVLGQLINQGDNAQMLAAFWGTRPQASHWKVKNHLRQMIRLNRLESFKFLHPRLDLSGDKTGQLACSLLISCVLEEREEIFCYLLSQHRFDPRRFFKNLNHEFASCVSSGSGVERGLAIFEVIVRVASKNGQIMRDPFGVFRDSFIDWAGLMMTLCSIPENGLAIINAAQHFASMFASIGQDRAHLYRVLMESLLLNRHLSDEDMVWVLNPLLELGLEVDEGSLGLLANVHPNYALTHQALVEAQIPEIIKEPDYE
jgi:hypothetical protein